MFKMTKYIVCNCAVGSQRKYRNKVEPTRFCSLIVNCRLENEKAQTLPDTDLATLIRGSLKASLEGWRCDACAKGKAKAAKAKSPPPSMESYTKEKIYHPPEVLFMQLGRFTLDMYGNSVKVDRFVDIPETIDLQDFVEKKFIPQGTSVNYKLVATVLHSGTLIGGHYTCVTRRPGQPGQGDEWYEVDDNRVALLSDGMGFINKEDTSRSPSSPYMLAYVRVQDTKQPLYAPSIRATSPELTSEAATPVPPPVDDVTSTPSVDQKAKPTAPALANTENPSVSDAKSAGVKRSKESLEFDEEVKKAAKPAAKNDEVRIHLQLVDANGEILVSADRAIRNFDASMLDSVKLGVHITDKSGKKHDVTGKILEFLAGGIDAGNTTDADDKVEGDPAPTTTAAKDSVGVVSKTPAPPKAGSGSPPGAPKKAANAVAGKKRSRTPEEQPSDDDAPTKKKQKKASPISAAVAGKKRSRTPEEQPSDDDAPTKKKQKKASPISAAVTAPARRRTRSQSAEAKKKGLLDILEAGKAMLPGKAKPKSPSTSPKTPSKAAPSKVASPKKTKVAKTPSPLLPPFKSPSPAGGAVKKASKKSSKSGKSSKTTSPK